AALERPPFDSPRSIYVWARNRRACFLMLFAGLRIGEVADLEWEEVDLQRDMLRVLNGKGTKDRDIPINKALHDELSRVPPAYRAGAVCGLRSGEKMSKKSLAHLFENDKNRVGLEALGVEGITAHRLRHEFASAARRHGADLVDIQHLLGHVDLS